MRGRVDGERGKIGWSWTMTGSGRGRRNVISALKNPSMLCVEFFFSSSQARLYGLVFLLHGLLCDSSVFCFFFCRGTFTDVHRGTLI